MEVEGIKQRLVNIRDRQNGLCLQEISNGAAWALAYIEAAEAEKAARHAACSGDVNQMAKDLARASSLAAKDGDVDLDNRLWAMRENLFKPASAPAARVEPEAKPLPSESFKFSAYRLPVGSEFVLGKRRWKLVERQGHHPDFMTFSETSAGAHTPDRVMNPSEVDALYDLGVAFMVSMKKLACEAEGGAK